MSIEFDEKEKQNAFDRIAARYFQRNFGMMSKADFETLLFDIYIEHLLQHNLPFDDYTMSRALGITQSRIRTLKQRKELQYPHANFDWKRSFAGDVSKAKYDDANRRVTMSISDVNVLIELRNFIEQNGWFDHYQLNPKLFSCRLDFFIELCKKLSDENIDLDEDRVKELRRIECDGKSKQAIYKICSGAFEDGMKDLIKSASKEVIIQVLKRLPFGSVASIASIGIKAIISVIERT